MDNLVESVDAASAAGVEWDFPYCPAPPYWRLDWQGLLDIFPWLQALAGSPQDPIHHAEGDVLRHTQMVCEALVELSEWRQLSPEVRALLFATALLHDVAKPQTMVMDEAGRVSNPHHALHGSRVARQVVWREPYVMPLPWPFAAREALVQLVRYHGLPLTFLEKRDPRCTLWEASQVTRCDWLALFAQADVLGRECVDRAQLLDRVRYFVEFAAENQCLRHPRVFPTPAARYVYFAKGGDPDYVPYEKNQTPVIVLAGLPGVGKNTWLRKNAPQLPVVSLDALRLEMDVDPTDNQGAVVQQARAEAREYLRAGTAFAWNATNITRVIRQPLVRWLAAYGARVHLVYLEPPWEIARQRNRQRSSMVPEVVLDKLFAKLDVPMPMEAHQVSWCC